MRYDVVYYQHGGAGIDSHFCREWDDDDGGCYGTNETHGYSWEEAVAMVVEHFEVYKQVWLNKKEPSWQDEENGG